MTCVVFPLILQVEVEVEVTGNVEYVHAIDEDHVEGHHGGYLEDGRAPARERIHAGSVEDKPKTVNASFVLLLINEHWKKTWLSLALRNRFKSNSPATLKMLIKTPSARNEKVKLFLFRTL